MIRLDALVKDFPTKVFEKGTAIYKPGDKPKYAYLPLTGVVAIYSYDLNGIERRLLSAKEYEIIPNNWLISQDMIVEYHYKAFTKVICAEIDRVKFSTLLKKNPEALYELFLVQDNRLQMAKYRIETLIQPKAFDKLIYQFKYILERSSQPTSESGWVETMLPLTQSEFADALGLTRETVAKELQKLEKEGIVKPIGKGYYKINKKLLVKKLDGK